jgi:hypoxanthine-DNA glycosylase
VPECFAPVVGEDPKVLILGTMPGRVSLQKSQYYAHPRNQFWSLLGAVLGLDMKAMEYERRVAACKRHGVALWEVFRSCEREGSLDSAIEDPEPAEVPRLLREHGTIRAVFCNGGTSWKAFNAHFAEALPKGVEAFSLPSSSPAHAGMDFEDKLKDWMKIGRYLVLAVFLIPAAARAQSSGTVASTPPQPAQKELTLHDIVDRANKALRGDSSHGTMAMTIVTPSWQRTIEVEGWNRERSYAFILIHAPAKDKGNITLRRKNEMWLWLPKVERVIKIPPTMMHSAWQGSDFTYEDIVKADSVVKDYKHTLLKKRQEDGRVVYTIQGDPLPDAPVVWGKVVMDVAVYGNEEAVPLKEEDYSERGSLERTITLSDIKRLGGRLVPARLECVPTRKAGQKTILQYHSLEFDIPLTDDFFSLSRLQKGVKQ